MKKKLYTILLCAALAIPSYAVFNETNISQTISVLRHELNVTWQEKELQDWRLEKGSRMDEAQHRELVNTVRWINEMTLILYSQDKGYTLGQTYAMDFVRYGYNRFNKRKHPQFSNIEAINTEIERYQRLIEALRLLPPRLDAIEDVPDTLRQDIGDLDIVIDNINSVYDSLMTSINHTPLLKEPADSISAT